MQQEELILGYRLSPQQRHLWLLQQDNLNSPYRVQCAVQIEGDLDTSVLKASLDQAVARHESLRTTFRYLQGLSLPVQIISKAGVVWLGIDDLSNLSPQDREIEVNRLLQEGRETVFDFEKEPLLIVSLTRLSPSNNVLILTLPALSSDRAGIKNLVREISHCYSANLSGEQLSDEPAQYADVSEYLTELIESEDMQAGRKYWRNVGESSQQEIKLPFEKRLVAEEVFNPHFLALTIDREEALKIENMALSHKTEMSAILLACWQILLWRLTDGPKFVIGTAFRGRKFEGLEGLPGLFERYLPLKCDLEERPRFNELIQRVEESARSLAEWQDYFTWDAFQELKSGGKEPYFPISFEFDDGPTKFSSGELTFSICEQYSCVDRFQLKLTCIRNDLLITEFHYDSNLFSAENIECLAEQFHTLLGCAVNAPESQVNELGLLSAVSRQRLVKDLNDTEAHYRKDKLIHQLIEEQAERTPHETAIVFRQEQLSYAELNKRSNQLAHRLQEIGIGPDILVLIYMEQSVELIIGILGVLKAGGTYVPIDLTCPTERLTYILEETQAPLVLTQERLKERMPKTRAQIICLDTAGASINQESQDNPDCKATGDNLAYVIYTSGSTGRPKGVMIPHKGLSNYLQWACDAYRVAEGGGTILHSPIGFDLTITSMFSPLMVGKKVEVLAGDSGPESLADALRNSTDLSLLKVTPSHLDILSLLISEGEVSKAVRFLVVGGEALFAEKLSFWRAYAPEARIINEYGPTETVVGCCVFELEPGVSISGPVPIGKPISNTQMYILDERLEPAPINVTGDIYIGGEGLARGYLRSPHLTAESFVPNPFGSEPGARLYRTGDLGRYQVDGNIEFLGRSDHQVKLKSYRIELGEIEALMMQSPNARGAVVIVSGEGDEKHLLAYIVADGNKEAVAQETRSYLKARLPEYMTPTAFIVLREMPLTANGKVDRTALPAPDSPGPEFRQSYTPPRTHTEEVLAELWAKALVMDQVGIDEDFFELGGDSILSVQIANRANRLGIRFTPRQLFQHRKISSLAAALETGSKSKIESKQEATVGSIPLTPIQHWFFEQNLPDIHHWNQAIMLETKQPLSPPVLEKALQILVSNQDALRCRFIKGEPGWQQFTVPSAGDKLLTQFDLSQTPEAEQEQSLGEISSRLQASLNLSQGPLMQAALISFGGQKADTLLMILHHLAVDIISWGIILDYIQTAYQHLYLGQQVRLPSKTSSFSNWAKRLARHGKSAKLREESSFWLNESGGRPGKIPVDSPSAVNTEESARTVWVSLDPDETTTLLQDVPKAYHTMISDVLLTALAQAFSEWTGSRSFLIDIEGHGREEIFDDIELSRTVGWFTCIFPLLLDVGKARDQADALKTVKEKLRRVQNGGIGYGLLRYLSGDREITEALKAQPRAEACFNYVGRFDQSYADSPLFASAREALGPSHSLRGVRPYLLEITGGISQGRLQMAFIYSENVHKHSSIERFGGLFIQALRSIIKFCVSPDAGGRTPSDFLIGDVSQRELDKLISELAEPEE